MSNWLILVGGALLLGYLTRRWVLRGREAETDAVSRLTRLYRLDQREQEAMEIWR